MCAADPSAHPREPRPARRPRRLPRTRHEEDACDGAAIAGALIASSPRVPVLTTKSELKRENRGGDLSEIDEDQDEVSCVSWPARWLASAALATVPWSRGARRVGHARSEAERVRQGHRQEGDGVADQDGRDRHGDPGRRLLDHRQGREGVLRLRQRQRWHQRPPDQVHPLHRALNPAQEAAFARKLVESDKVAGIVGNTSFAECGVNWKYYKSKGFTVIGAGVQAECFGTPSSSSRTWARATACRVRPRRWSGRA